MLKPRIKKVYFPSLNAWFWQASYPEHVHDPLPLGARNRLTKAKILCVKLNQAETYERHAGRELEK